MGRKLTESFDNSGEAFRFGRRLSSFRTDIGSDSSSVLPMFSRLKPVPARAPRCPRPMCVTSQHQPQSKPKVPFGCVESQRQAQQTSVLQPHIQGMCPFVLSRGVRQSRLPWPFDQLSVWPVAFCAAYSLMPLRNLSRNVWFLLSASATMASKDTTKVGVGTTVSSDRSVRNSW